jgi:aminoglycoside phosphotransferase (APT) family kinase protein
VLVGELIGRARAVVAAPGVDPSAHGLVRVPGGMTHDVFAPVDDPTLVVKVFRSADRDEAEREWDALVALAGSGVAPDPVRFDAGEPAIVVMARVSGSPRSAGALDAEHARVIGRVHRLVHRAVPRSPRPVTHAGVVAARASLMRDARDEASSPHDDASDTVAGAWRAARTWIAHAELPRLVSSDGLRFSRGDPNLGNYLWTDAGLVLIDFEHSGLNDPALELADMAEHASTRALGEDFWIELADATGLTPADRAQVPHARRLMACCWLVMIEQRQREGLPTTIALEEQARRTLAVLGG